MRTPLLLVAVSLAVIGCSGGEAEDGGDGGGSGGFAMPVEVASAFVDTVVETIQATGQIEPVQSIRLRPEVDGRIVEIMFREGTAVAAGSPLFKVDDAELTAQVARATADRDLAQQALERTRALLDQDASSVADLEQAEATYRSTQAQLDLLSIRLERTTVRAPFGGLVGSRLVSLGDYVTTSTPLVSLQTYNPQRATFLVPERFADQLAEGQEVVFRVAALPGRDFRGIVEFIDPVVQLPARVFTVKARVPNPRRELAAGMFIDVRLAVDVRGNAVIVPEAAVVPLEGLNVIWAVGAEGQVERREVTLGVRTPGLVEVRSGIDPGEQVVVGGQARLAPGMPVTPIPVDQPRPEPGADTPADSAPAAASADSAGG